MSLKRISDQMGRSLTVRLPPKRIVSLVPSQTEFLIEIGAAVVGRTKFCIHPKENTSKIPIVGGTKNFRFDRIKFLNPDLIIGNKEENYKEGIDLLSEEFPVWMSDISTLDDAFQMMTAMGKICNLETASAKIISESKIALEQVKASKSGKALYLIWKNPWMAAGNGTFIDHMLGYLGFDNVVKQARYPELSLEDIILLDPEHILFSSEPFPFKQSDVDFAQILWPNANSQLVDGQLYSWYGSRLRKWNDEASR